MGIKLTKEEFVKRSRLVHGDKYDYSKAEYINSRTKTRIICPIHGEFWQTPQHHMEGFGCARCSGCNKKTTEEFIQDARKIHGDKYDYSKTDYKGNKIKVCIVCPKHGEFWQKPNNHLSGREGCPECAKTRKSAGESRIMKFLNSLSIKYIHDKASVKCLKQKRPDFYLPDYNLIIEYDGKQHFSQPHGAWKSWYVSLEKIQKDDAEKERILLENGYDVLRIPYWDFDNIEKIITRRLKLITEEKQ